MSKNLEVLKGLVGSRINLNGEWNVVKVKYMPHVTPVAEFQCGKAGSTLSYLQKSILSARTTNFHRGQAENYSQHDSHSSHSTV